MEDEDDVVAATTIAAKQDDDVDEEADSVAECDFCERYCGWFSTATVGTSSNFWSQMITIKININSEWTYHVFV